MPRKEKKSHKSSSKMDEEDDQLLLDSRNMEHDMMQEELAQSGDATLGLILKELRDFRKDSNQQLIGIKEDINRIHQRMEEAEERINTAETRIQSWEEVVSRLVKLQEQTEAKLTDLEGRSRRDNVRIYGVKEGAEDGTTSMTAFVEELLMRGLELPPSTALNIERAHSVLNPHRTLRQGRWWRSSPVTE